MIFDFRFLALLAVAGSLAGSLLCFLNVSAVVFIIGSVPSNARLTPARGDQGCVYIKEAFNVYWTSCLRGVHSGQMVLKVVEAIGVFFFSSISINKKKMASLVEITLSVVSGVSLTADFGMLVPLQMCILPERSC